MNALAGILIVLAGILALVGLQVGWLDIMPRRSEVEELEPLDKPDVAPLVVELSAEKLAAAGISTVVADWQRVQANRLVPGTITYDATKRLSVTAPVAGLVRKVLVEPGQQVSLHQPLAELSSPEVGLARDEVLRREADLALSLKQQAWSDQIAANVADLLALLSQKPKLEDVEAALSQRTLGEFREKILAAYSKLIVAETALSGSETLESTLSRRTLEERRGARAVAAAEYLAARETARFSAAQARDKARADVEHAERLLAVAQRSLANLLGLPADMSPVVDRSQLSELVVLAPLSGRIEERHAVESARVEAGGPLFVIADTTTLWVSAEIHERDWPALNVAQEGEITVRIPALQDGQLAAKVRFIGAQVAEETRSVPLVAEFANRDGRLKPGMFVWVEAPLQQPRQALVVPAGAIMRHENQAFVFMPAGERSFRRVDVELGLETPDHIEIVSGLQPGDTIVDRGAFYLKSELLLEREE